MFIVKKKIGQQEYYYLRESKRSEGKVRAITLAYLGKTKKDALRKKEDFLAGQRVEEAGAERDKKQDREKNTMSNEKPENKRIIITYFVHGTTTDNEQNISSGWKDVELSELGVKQSKELPKQIGNKKFDVVFCSDLKRAVDSAEISFKGKFPIKKDRRLRECNYGDYNGKSSDIVEPLQENNITKRFPNGESYEDVKLRITSFLEELKKNYEGKNVAIVAHKAPQLVLDVLLKGKSWEQAFHEDWRKRKAWQPGWDYVVSSTEKNRAPEQNHNKKETESEKEFLSFITEAGLIWGPEPEIYGGLSGFYTYGPLGKLLKNKVENSVRKIFNANGFREIEGPTIMPDAVWKASGHLDTFTDPVIRTKDGKESYRADKLLEENGIELKSVDKEYLLGLIKKHKIKSPTGKELADSIENYSLMMKTSIAGQDASLRPETATVTYLPFLRYWNYFRKKVPFGVYQIGKAYRNEISPRQHVLRGREFTQAEGQIFVDPAEKNNWSKFDEVAADKLPLWTSAEQKGDEKWKMTSLSHAVDKGLMKSKAYAWAVWMAYNQFVSFGIPSERIRLRQHQEDEKAFYADDAWDVEINLNNYGWIEVCGVHDRTDYDLKQHSKHSGVALEGIRENGERFVPHILEIAFGTDRPSYALIDLFYEKKTEGEGKTVFKLPYHIAPISVAVFPLMKKPELLQLAENVKEILEKEFVIEYDIAGSIGRRYLRASQAGTPFCITIDYDSLEKKDVTIRDRDTEKQVRVKIDLLKETLGKLISGEMKFEDV